MGAFSALFFSIWGPCYTMGAFLLFFSLLGDGLFVFMGALFWLLLACFIVCTAYVVKFDSTVAKTGSTQIIRRGHIHLKNNHNIIIIIL